MNRSSLLFHSILGGILATLATGAVAFAYGPDIVPLPDHFTSLLILFSIVMLASPVAVGILVHILLQNRRWKKTFAGLSVLLGYIVVFFTYVPIFVLVFGI